MGKKYFAEGRVDKAGKRFHFCEGMIYYFENDEKIIVAKCTTTMAVV
jgi:acyl-coenzyme A thioesterase PaaI-like protein